jgi:hypothetical protein
MVTDIYLSKDVYLDDSLIFLLVKKSIKSNASFKDSSI